MAKKKKKNLAQGDALTRALLAAEAEFGPQERQVQTALAENNATKNHQVKSSLRQGDQLAAHSIAGIGDIKQIYGQVGQGAAQQQGFVDSVISAGASGPGSAVAAGIARDRVGAANNRDMQQAAAVTRQQEMAGEFRRGGQFGAANARRQGNQNKLKLLDTLQGILADKGNKTAVNYQKEIDADFGRDMELARLNLSTQEYERKVRKDAADAEADAKGGKKGKFTAEDRRSTRNNVETGVGGIKAAGGVPSGRKKLNPTTGKNDPVMWSIEQAKQGIRRNGSKGSRRQAVKEYETYLVKQLKAKYDTLMARAIAQTYIWGGVGKNTAKAFNDRYEVKLPQFKAK